MKKTSFLLLLSMSAVLPVAAQDYYDDDIYYDPSKAKVEKQEKVDKTREVADFEEPTYQVYNTSPRDVDEYNRRGGQYAMRGDSLQAEPTANADVFAYTEQIERFDNPDIVKGSTDERLKELYYADDVNIYIGVPTTSVSFSLFSPWDSWYYPGWYTSWYSPWYYSSWYSPFYPYYGWNNWYWGSYWGPYWGWHHYFDPCWYPYHHGYYGHYYASTHRYSNNSRRPFGGNSGSVGSPGRRPSSGSYNSLGTTGRRPSSSSYTRPANRRPTTTNGYRGSEFGRGGSNGFNSNRGSSDLPFYNNNSRPSYNNNNQNRMPSYNNNSNRGSSFNSGRSSMGGSRGSFGGGSRGGGGGRGGRR